MVRVTDGRDWSTLVQAWRGGSALEPIADLGIPSDFSGTLAASGLGPRAYWWGLDAEDDSRAALWARVLGSDEIVSLTTVPRSSLYVRAPSVDGEDAWLSMPSELRHIHGTEVTSFAIDGVVWGRAVARTRDGITHVLWHSLGEDGTVDATVTTMEAGAVLRTQKVLEHLSGEASLLWDARGLWVAGFEQTWTSLTNSHLRIAHLHPSDLSRQEADRTLDGWGGIAPLAAELLEIGGRPWLVLLTGDARFGSGVALHARPLSDTSCDDHVQLPLAALGREGWGASVESASIAPLADGSGFVVAHDAPTGLAIHRVDMCSGD